MPSISYRELIGGEATTEAVWNGHTIALTYDPAAVTDSAYRDIKRLGQQTIGVNKTGKSGKAGGKAGSDDAAQISAAMVAIDGVLDLSATVNALLRRFLVSWDLTDDDGETMFPITDERLGDLPLDFRQTCLNALMMGSRMGEANGTTSKAPSAATTPTGARAGSRR